MTKEQFVKEMAQRGNMKVIEADKLCNLFLDTLKYSIREYGGVKFSGLGKFFVKEHKERIGRNMSTGEPMTIPKHNTVKFTVSEIFKDSLNE